MLIKTLLNRCYWLKSFVYTKASMEMVKSEEAIVVQIEPRKNRRVCCSGCGRTASGYDHMSEARHFEFVPLWGMKVYFRYRMRRVNCRRCGVKVEEVPWAKGKSHLSWPMQWFLAQWARRLSWEETARVFRTNWRNVFESVEAMVRWGLKRRDMSGIEAIGVDEVQYHRGHHYLTVVYQLDEGRRRLLGVFNKRNVKSLLRFFWELGAQKSSQILYVCSDLWKPYLKVIKKKAPQALHILDRFHLVANLNKALNEIRAAEARRLQRDGYINVLVKSKYCFFKNPQNLTPTQQIRLKEVLQYDLKSVRAYLLKESFQLLWHYKSPYWAQWYLKKWCTRAMRSRLKPIKRFVRSVRKHEPLILNWFRAKKAFSCGIVEGFNRNINLTIRKAYGFKSFEVLKIALFHTMGDLPEPEITHRFC